MTRREQIIIGLAALAGAYGLFEYVLKPHLFGDGPPPPPEVDIQELVALAGQISPDPRLQENIAFVLENREHPWPAAAFFDRPYDPAAGDATPAAGVATALAADKYSYSGFMKMNDERIAIINGIDYRQGEIMDDYRLDEILPEKVVLSRDGAVYSIQAKESED
ncbi:MAG: general secretion pathway protein GspB [Thermodesulfobacteriota bacterium]